MAQVVRFRVAQVVRSVAEVPLSSALLLRCALAMTELSGVRLGELSVLGATARRCVAEVPFL